MPRSSWNSNIRQNNLNDKEKFCVWRTAMMMLPSYDRMCPFFRGNYQLDCRDYTLHIICYLHVG